MVLQQCQHLHRQLIHLGYKYQIRDLLSLLFITHLPKSRPYYSQIIIFHYYHQNSAKVIYSRPVYLTRADKESHLHHQANILIMNYFRMIINFNYFLVFDIDQTHSTFQIILSMIVFSTKLFMVYFVNIHLSFQIVENRHCYLYFYKDQICFIEIA